MLVRSLQRALNKDKASRRITQPSLGPLFSDQSANDDVATGHVYVLRSKSEMLISGSGEGFHYDPEQARITNN